MSAAKQIRLKLRGDFGTSKGRGIAALLIGVVLLAGCGGPEYGRVEGRVTLDGKPLAVGTVVFEDSSRGISVSDSVDAAGNFTIATYNLPGLPPGDYQVAVRPGKLSEGETPLVSENAARGDDNAAKIPSRYFSSATSGLTAEVKQGSNMPYVFDLKSAAE